LKCTVLSVPVTWERISTVAAASTWPVAAISTDRVLVPLVATATGMADLFFWPGLSPFSLEQPVVPRARSRQARRSGARRSGQRRARENDDIAPQRKRDIMGYSLGGTGDGRW
jgi:hypothetical protein